MRINKDSIDKWFDYSLMLDTRTIMLADESEGIDDALANTFLKGIHLLEQKPDPIKIILRSNGGCSFAGMAIYDSIKKSECHTTIDVYGSAMSMASVILQAGDDRVMQPNALLMVHDGTFSTNDSLRTFENWAAMSKRLRKQMYEIFADRSGKTVRYWEKKCEADFVMTATEALNEGLIDRVANERN